MKRLNIAHKTRMHIHTHTHAHEHTRARTNVHRNAIPLCLSKGMFCAGMLHEFYNTLVCLHLPDFELTVLSVLVMQTSDR